MIIRIQMLSMSQAADVLSLLEFPQLPLRPPLAKMQVTRRSRGRVFTHRSGDIRRLIARFSEDQLNAVEVRYRFDPYSAGPDGILISTLQAFLRISVTNVLWADKNTWPEHAVHECYMEAVRAGAEGHAEPVTSRASYLSFRKWLSMPTIEGFTKNGIVIPYPTFFEVYMTVVNSVPAEQVYKWLLPGLAASVPAR